MPFPPPPPPSFGTTVRQARPSPPVVTARGPPRALLLELVIYSGAPFGDRWAYFVRSSYNPSAGVMIHATGDVRNGFQLQIKRSYDFASTSTVPTSRTPLQWIDGRFLDERAMLHNGNYKNDDRPVCGFEGSLCKIKVPEKSLNATSHNDAPQNRVVQRNCQTWVVESADQLVADGILSPEVATYLHATKQ
ncbi:hypothetical protein FGADI_435 [Fusarium gaditjirri]|uniref:Uncharacterized protein n=1 Tax=Fusarium gaditjirri TaxID=282569 RepID=A0A8H4TNE9_9HYPO|nr:hypothetical protein FGADI_435 [Fusarium gaditjirri]